MKQFRLIGAAVILLTLGFFSCDNELDLPEAGSIPDVTPPLAEFEFSGGETVDDFLNFQFANLSIGATTYSWDFGDGTTSSEFEPIHIFPAEGTFTVTLVSSDDLAVTSTFTETIEVIEPEESSAITPNILEPSFEDLSLPDGTGDGRDSWRNNALGSIFQINTSSSVPDGMQASKFPSDASGDGVRIGYQEVAVTPNTEYLITYSYRLEAPGGTATVSILAGGGFTDIDTVDDAEITSFSGSAESYTQVSLAFNSGNNDVISILLRNAVQEARIDNFEAFINE